MPASCSLFRRVSRVSLAARPFPLVATVFGHATCSFYVCMYVIGLVSCFVEQHFYFRFRVFFSLSLSLLFVRNRIKERNRSTRGLIFFEFVRIHCSSSSLCLKKKQDEVYREGRESRLARPPSTSSGSLTLGLRLLAPGFRLVSERESPLFRFPSHPASTGSPVVQRKKGFRAK